MIKKVGIIGKLFEGKKRKSNCCSFEIEEVIEESTKGKEQDNCCNTPKEKNSYCDK